MPGSSNQYAYQLGTTLVAIPVGTAVQIIPPRTTNGIYFGWQTGGTLAVCNSLGLTAAQGMILQTTERVSVAGPSTFFLAAAGTTSVAAIMFRFSSGFSQLP